MSIFSSSIGSRSRRPHVLRVIRGAVFVERQGEREPTAVRAAILAHWSASERLSRSVCELVRQLKANGYAVVVISTCEGPGPLEAPGSILEDVMVLRRPNVGYDFGSWATGLDRVPWIRECERVLLLNDSLAGPFDSIGHLLEKFHSSSADVWGLTDTMQFGHHLQSYALGFRDKVLTEPALRAFWDDIRVERTKADVIRRYEIGLSRFLRREGFVLDAAIRHSSVVKEQQNPTIIGWRRLLDHGFPFVKRELVSAPAVAPDGWEVPSLLKARFGVDVTDWL